MKENKSMWIDFEEVKIMKQKCNHSKYVFFIFLMKIDCLIQCILTSNFLTSTSPNSAPSSSLFSRSPPLSFILRKRGRPPRYNNQAWKNTRYTKTRQIPSYRDWTRKPRRRKISHKYRQNVRDTGAPSVRSSTKPLR